MSQSYNNTHHMKTKHRDKDRTRDYAKVWLFLCIIGLYLELDVTSDNTYLWNGDVLYL